jgi:hypothetical protein
VAAAELAEAHAELAVGGAAVEDGFDDASRDEPGGAGELADDRIRAFLVAMASHGAAKYTRKMRRKPEDGGGRRAKSEG